MRIHSSQLHTLLLDNGSLFDFSYDMPEDYKPIFEKRFIDYYMFYQISFDSFFMFKKMIESRLNLLLPRYNKLYESEKVISNPFVNFISQTDAWQRERGRNKTYSVSNNKNINSINSNSASYGNTRQGERTTGIVSTLGHSEDSNNLKKINEMGDSKLNYFTDTPQIEQQENEDKLFNDGFITTKTRDEQRQTNLESSNVSNTTRASNQSSNDASTDLTLNSDSSNQNESLEQSQNYNDLYTSSGLESTNKRIVQEYGLRNITVTSILNEWRNSFLNIDMLLIKEFRDLFLFIY